MTQFNFKNLENNLQHTQEGANKSGGSGRKYPFRAVFVRPNNAAKLNVRVLYNVKSDAVSFAYKIHELSDKSKVTCGRNNVNDPTCELCDALQTKFTMTKVKPQETARARAIMFAQYIDDTGYDWTDEFPKPAVGETILVMGPESLHKTVSDTLLNVGYENLPKLISNPTGSVVTIARDAQGKQVVAMINPFKEFYSGYDEANMAIFLAGLPSLQSVAFFGGITDEDYTKLHEAAQAVNRSMRPGATMTPTPQTTGQMAAQGAPIGFQPGIVPAQYSAPAVTAGYITPVAQPAQPAGIVTATPAPATTYIAPAMPMVTDSLPQSFAGTTNSAHSFEIVEPLPVKQPVAAPTAPAVPNGFESFISTYCDKVYGPEKDACSLCLAEKFCPYKVK